jgi:hypothetical protein
MLLRKQLINSIEDENNLNKLIKATVKAYTVQKNTNLNTKAYIW